MTASRTYRSPLLIFMFTILMAQGSAQSAPRPSAITPPQKFDVASIRPSSDRTGPSAWLGIQITGDRFEARSMPLSGLVWFAYAGGSQSRQMVAKTGGWIDSQQWDIVAKIDDPSLAGLSDAELSKRMRPMVQALLEDRFHLKLHTEMRPTPVYALVQAKGGAHVKEVPPPPDVQGNWADAMERYQEENPGKPFPGAMTCSGSRCTATAVTISEAVGTIGANSHTDRMVIDETGLKGHYDFSFRTAHNEDDDPMAEIEQDLGMRFESRKIDLKTYVIDSAEKPSPN